MATASLKASTLADCVPFCKDDPSTPKTMKVKVNARTLRGDQPQVRSVIFGEEKSDTPRRVILIASDKAVQKDEIVNGFINYALGVNWEDDYRFRMTEEVAPSGWTMVHTLNHQPGFVLPYTLVIVYVLDYSGSMLIDIENLFPSIDQYYYACKAGEVKDKKRMKIFARDMDGRGVQWSLLLTGSGTKTLEHIAKNAADSPAYTQKYFTFPAPDAVFADHKDIMAKKHYAENMATYANLLE